MRVISWNIKGRGSGSFKPHLTYLLAECNPDIIILMETKVNSNRAEQVIQTLEVPNYI